MKKQHISSDIGRRAEFFHYFFKKNRSCIGEYRTVTAMVFDKRAAEIIQQQNIEKHSDVSEIQNYTHVQTINEIHHHSEVEHHEPLQSSKSFAVQPQSTQTVQNHSSEPVHHPHSIESVKRDFHTSVVNRFLKVKRDEPSVTKEKAVLTEQKMFHMPKETPKQDPTPNRKKEPSVTMHYQRENKQLVAEEIKMLEDRIVTRLEEKIVRKKDEKREHALTQGEHIVKQREEKNHALADTPAITNRRSNTRILQKIQKH